MSTFFRLAFSIIIVSSATFLVYWAFAPPWLLLDAIALDVETPLATRAASVIVGAEIAMLAIMLVLLRHPLRQLAQKEPITKPADILALFSIPSRMAYIHVAVAAVVALATTLPWLRPTRIDAYTQGALAVLLILLVSTATLPLYVAARASIVRIVETAPVEVSREALSILGDVQGETRRVRRRFLSAVAAPVALIAIGASLLVYAHSRAYESRARRDDATALAAATLDLVEGRDEGRLAAIERARDLGYSADVEQSAVWAYAFADEPTAVIVTLDDGQAVVRFEPPELGSVTITLLLWSLFTLVLAALSGYAIGTSFSRDVRTATREVDSMGVVDVLRGAGFASSARFDSLRMLGEAIERLAGIFAEFASAQERAIDARASTERARGLLLASMSHDLKGPLNSILGFAALVGKRELLPAQRESLTIIEHRGKELLSLIQTVLDSARAESGQLDLSRESCSAADVVMSAVLDARDFVDAANVVAEVQPDLPNIVVDSARVVEAITAVISSAARITENKPVTVRASMQHSALRVVVEAVAGNLDRAERDRMFEAFRSPDLARKHGSLGLGLALARAIFEAHGGSLRAEAEGERLVFIGELRQLPT